MQADRDGGGRALTFSELQRLVGSITFCGGLKAWGLRLHCRYCEGSQNIEPMVVVAVSLHALPERDSGQLDRQVGIIEEFLSESALAAMGRETAMEWIHRNVVRQIVLHEADESILYRDARVFDPHRPEELDSAMRSADEAASAAPDLAEQCEGKIPVERHGEQRWPDGSLVAESQPVSAERLADLPPPRRG